MKSTDSPVLLSPVDKSSALPTLVTPEPYISKLQLVTREYEVNNKALVHIREQLDGLLAGCSPDVRTQIGYYLDTPAESDRWLLDAWEKCGRSDQGRSLDIKLTETARSSLTALGLACLVRYCRGWLDEAEARVAALQSRVAKAEAAGRPNGPAGRPPPEQPRARRPHRAAAESPAPAKRLPQRRPR